MTRLSQDQKDVVTFVPIVKAMREEILQARGGKE
jgi:hypothetical protein